MSRYHAGRSVAGLVRTAAVALLSALLLASCSSSGLVVTDDGKDIEFRSGDFRLVGDLHLPEGIGPHPAVIVVHGDGPQTRTSTPGTGDVTRVFGDAGFAVFAWDKPGSGDSTGEFAEGETLRQRAAILADGVRALGEHPKIDAGRIGLWGLSQAGWVMPLALELTDDVAFMIVVSGGGEDGIEQTGYRLGQQLVCQGLSPNEGRLVVEYFPQSAKGPTYSAYAEAMEVLVRIDGWESFAGPSVRTEDEWQPWPTDIDAYFDPMTVIERATMPVLAVFGEQDRYVDPIQGAAAYEAALRSAGNPDYQVELIPGVGHTMKTQSTMCGSGGATSQRYLELIQQWAAKLSAQ